MSRTSWTEGTSPFLDHSRVVKALHSVSFHHVGLIIPSYPFERLEIVDGVNSDENDDGRTWQSSVSQLHGHHCSSGKSLRLGLERKRLDPCLDWTALDHSASVVV